MDIVFVVLHYLAVDDTIECVASILQNIDTDCYKIVVVDNASPDGSFACLHEKYASNSFVHLIQNKENLGFAKGNNVGFRFAKHELNANFIVLLNNDICLYQKNMYQIIQQKYKEYNFSVLGPMILTKDGLYTSNPFRWKLPTYGEYMHAMQQTKRAYFIDSYAFLSALYGVPRRMKRMFKALSAVDEQNDGKNECRFSDCTQIVLHGSFMVFSQEYIKENDGLNDKTFMYSEEDILALQLLQENKVILYTPDILVYHKEDVSTNAVNIGAKKKEQLKRQRLMASMQVYMQLLKSYQDKTQK